MAAPMKQVFDDNTPQSTQSSKSIPEKFENIIPK